MILDSEIMDDATGLRLGRANVKFASSLAKKIVLPQFPQLVTAKVNHHRKAEKSIVKPDLYVGKVGVI